MFLEDGPQRDEGVDQPQEVNSGLGGLIQALFGGASENEVFVGETEESEGEEMEDAIVIEEDREVPCGLHDTTIEKFGNTGDSTFTVDIQTTGDEDYDMEEEDPMMDAVWDVLSTPQSVEAEPDAIEAIEGVQEECSADFEQLCTENESSATLEYVGMPTFSSDIFGMFNSMHSSLLAAPTNEYGYEPSDNFLYLRRRLMETEREHQKLEARSEGLKKIRDIRGQVLTALNLVPGKRAKAETGPLSRRVLTNKPGAKPAGQSKRNFGTSTGLPTPEKLHRKAELEKLSKMRSEYNFNPNRSKLSTRLSHVAPTEEVDASSAGRKLSVPFPGAPPNGGPPKGKPKPGPGPSDSRKPPPKSKPGSLPSGAKPKPKPQPTVKTGPGFRGQKPGPPQPTRDEDFRWMRYAGSHLGTDVEEDGEYDDVIAEDKDGDTPYILGQPLLQDDIYSGSLGFGDEGDTCMYSYYPQLSQPCKGAISDLYDFREDYYASTQPSILHPYHRHHGGFVIAMIVCALVIGIVGYKRGQKTKQIRKILDVIDANPNLKSQVEELAGCEIPEHNSGWKSAGSFARSTLRNSFKLIALVFVSTFVVVTSLIITCLILAAMSEPPEGCDDYSPAEQTGEDPNDICSRHGPGIFVALLLLFTVASTEVYILYFLSTACGRLIRRRRTLPSSSDGNSLGMYATYFGDSSTTGDGGDYVALSGTESSAHQQEMTSMSPTVVPDHRPPPQQQQQRLPDGVVTGKLVRAVPVSSINYI